MIRVLRFRLRDLALAAIVMLGTACVVEERRSPDDRNGIDRASAAEGVATGISTSDARFVRNIIGFQGPESVRYDPEQDVFFVSNMAGYGSAKDGNGYISRVSAANTDSAVIFVQGGKNGVVLDAPKGMAIHGDTLWVADITVMRAFDRHTGAPLATIDLAPYGVVQANDVALGPDSVIRVTDTGIIMGKDGVVNVGPYHIFALGPSGGVTIAAQGPELRRPNGITWDPVGKRWIVISFDPFVGDVVAIPTDFKSRKPLWTGKGQLDGVEVLRDGTILFTSWADSSVHALKGTSDRRIIREVPVAADIGVDTRRNRLAIPLSALGRVQIWDISQVMELPKP